MSGYTKLFSSILASTIWRADNPTRLVWITMMAMSDRFGCVAASIPGLADMARVSLEECEKALISLQSPDKYSRSQEFDGRRVMPIEGGWQLVNHGKYRKILSEDERREYLRQKQQQYRAKIKAEAVTVMSTPVNNVSDPYTLSTQALPDPDPDPNPERSKHALKRRVSAARVSPEFEAFWDAYPRHVGKAKARAAWEKIAPDAATVQRIVSALGWQRTQPAWTKDGGEFVPHPTTWLNGRRWEDEPFHAPIETASATPRGKGHQTIAAVQRAVEQIERENQGKLR
jgi:hypothetical protein